MIEFVVVLVPETVIRSRSISLRVGTVSVGPLAAAAAPFFSLVLYLRSLRRF